MKKTVYLFVNGIKTRPGASKNWTGRAVTATHEQFQADPWAPAAEKVEYHTLAITRAMYQKHRARKLIKVLDHYDPFHWHRVIVAHSNGADVALDALRMAPQHRIQRIHLISPAVTWDCDKNGLGSFLRTGQLSQPPALWIAGKDKALRFGGSWVGRMLGYGALGLKGPKPGTLPCRSGYCEPNFGHSEWFDDKNFENTMHRIWTT